MGFWCLVFPILAPLAVVLLVPPVLGVREILFGIDARSARRVAIGATLLTAFSICHAAVWRISTKKTRPAS